MSKFCLGVQKWVFDELKTKNKISFEYKDKERPEGYVVSLSSRLPVYPIEEVVSAPYSLEEFDPELIQSLLDSMTVDNFKVFLSSHSLENEVNLVEKYFGIKYSVNQIPQELKTRLRNSTLKPSKSKKRIDLPIENIFMPKNFEILPVQTPREVPVVIIIEILYKN